MGKSGFVLLTGAIVAVVLHCAAAQTVHVVGDNLGWVIPQTAAVAYTNWASTQNFVVGDILTFNFGTNEHDVLQVSKASYDACTSTNAIGTPITNGPANISLTTAGNHYYICTFGRHCQNGQKLAITVSASPGTISPSGSLGPPTNTPPTSPSPTSGTPADCAPTPTLTPKSGEPTAQTTPPSSSIPPAAGPTTPGSSSAAVFASFFVTLLSIATGFFF